MSAPDLNAIRARADDLNRVRGPLSDVQVGRVLRDVFALCDEVERLRHYRSLPDGYVWQDYYSPEEVLKIREPLDAENERLQAWKAEALPVIAGLQELGRTLGLPLGTSITGEQAADKATELTAENERLRAVIAEVEKDAEEVANGVWGPGSDPLTQEQAQEYRRRIRHVIGGGE